MSRLEISLLGSFQARLDGQPIAHFRADTVRALLAYLALHAQSPCRRERLAGLLWPDEPEPVARQNLRQVLSLLRKAIGDREATSPFLHVTRKTIQFNPESDYWLDVTAFTDLLAACEGHRHRRMEACRPCVQRLREAAELYHGDFFGGFSLPSAPFEEWLVGEREWLHCQALDAFHHLAAYHERRGEYERARHYAQRQIELEGWREGAHRQMMRALALSGQRAAALAQYEICRRTLLEELDAEPEEETRALYERILGLSKDGADAHALLPVPAHNLPASLTPFVGREAELQAIETCLQDPDCRLLTLVGPGGIGKTRLALEAASAQRYGFEHGVYLASLAPLGSAESIVPTIGQAIGFSFYGGEDLKQQLLAYLREKRMLLLLDNYEHLLEGADLTVDILRAAPGVKLVVTSRATLNVPGEHLYPVTGMECPVQALLDPQDALRYSTIALFSQGAQQVEPSFELTAENLLPVTQICRFVQGMPLGILLAAAWMQVMTANEIVRQLKAGAVQSLDLLEPGWRGVPERHRSMRAVFDHSWCLLSERQRQVFAGLSVFRGGFALEAAQEVARASLRDLKALVSSSMLQCTPGGRYEVHELLRQYAQEKLEASPTNTEAVRARHSAYYLAALQRWESDLKGSKQQATLSAMDAEISNARVAWEWAVMQRDAERLNRALEGLCLYYEWRERHREAELMLRTAAKALDAIVCASDASPASPVAVRALAKILAWQANFASEHEVAREPIARCQGLLEDPALTGSDARRDRAAVLLSLERAAVDLGVEQIRAQLEECLSLYRALGDRWGAASALHSLAFLAWFTGDYDQARQRANRSLEIFRSLGDPRGAWWAITWLMSVALCRGEIEESERLGREHKALSRAFGDPGTAAAVLWFQGHSYVLRGRYAEADAAYERAATIYRELGASIVLARAISNQSLASTWAGAYERARAQAHRALEMAQERDTSRQEFCGHARMALGAAALAEGAWADAEYLFGESLAIYEKGRQEDNQERALGCLGLAARGLGRYAQARQYLSQALRAGLKTRGMIATAIALSVSATLLCDAGETERAIEIYALATRYPFAAHSPWFEDVFGRAIAAAESLPPEVVAAARARGRARDLEATVREMLVELEAEMQDGSGMAKG
jgi:predicted ATPase/DNA-binding SARP family transcriptional activator